MHSSSEKHILRKFAALFYRWKDVEDSFNWDIYNQIVKAKKIKGIGASNIQHILGDPTGRRLTVQTIRKVCLALDKDFQEVCDECGIEYSLVSGEYRSRNRIIAEQRSLSEGDEVWIMGCRRFLEETDNEIRSLVIENLQNGVVYKYYYPHTLDKSDRKHPFGTDSMDSFRFFVDSHLPTVGFSFPPRIFGFALDPRYFPYFSKLHTLVYHFKKSSPNTFRRMYAFMPYEIQSHPADDESYEWCPLPRSVANEIESNIVTATVTDAYYQSSLMKVGASQSRLRRTYRKFFTNDRNLNIYRQFRALVDYEPYVLQKVNESASILESTGVKEVSFLDIGSGDGVLSSKILSSLDQTIPRTKATLLDSSNLQLDRAFSQQKNLKNASLKPLDFESFQSQNELFHLITAIHSFYAIPAIYIQKVLSCLYPGGIAFILIASRKNNVFSYISQILDLKLFQNQERTSAEDLIDMCDWLGIKNRCQFVADEIPNFISNPFVNPDSGDDLETIISFCCLMMDSNSQAQRKKTVAEGKTAIESFVKSHNGDVKKLHTVDYALTFRKL